MLISESDTKRSSCIGQDFATHLNCLAPTYSLVQRSADSFKTRYNIGRTLGAGEFAVVKAAIDTETHEKVFKFCSQIKGGNQSDQIGKQS